MTNKIYLLRPKPYCLGILAIGLISIILASDTLYASPFLSRQGKNLILNGKIYTMVGLNAFTLTGCGASPTNAQLDTFFAGLRPHSLVRTWAFSNLGINAMDKVVSVATKYNQMLIMSLADGCCSCGELDGALAGDGSGKIALWYVNGYKGNYLNWVRTIVPRYKNSPAIGMWEIINEPIIDNKNNYILLKNFVDTMGALIKKYDPNHLVETGTHAPWAYGGQAGYQALHTGSDIDVCSMHEYDYDYHGGRTIMSPHFLSAINAANTLKKPLIIGEIGITSGNDCTTSRQLRSDAMKQKFDVYINGGAASVLVWNWQARDPGTCGYDFGFRDPILSMIQKYSLTVPSAMSR